MIELFVTCFIAGTFIPSQDWKVVEVSVPSPYRMTLNTTYCGDVPCPDLKPYVKLNRIMRIGEVIETPKDCQVQATVK